jgi:acetylornithine/succinyldiaminopimelate/putrescine aminotransferase
MDTPCIVTADNDILVDDKGRRYIDLFTGHGATWLGHCNPEARAAVAEQLGKIWLSGALRTPVLAEATALVESFFPASHFLAALYSTGMEAAEFALRIARGITRRNGVVGFARSMHGKSLATAQLGWDNQNDVPWLRRLPFVPVAPEDEILRRLGAALACGEVGAVFIEPLQGSGGGHAASAAFCREVARLCRQQGAILIFDEILTGFHRTGPAFWFAELGFVPDVVLIGKALGNGFPVSGVVLNKEHEVRQEMLPGSTYSGNPLAAAAVLATLRQMRRLDLPGKVARIEEIVLKMLAPLREAGVELRGRGALWIIEPPSGADVFPIVANIYRRGVCVGHAGRFLRILPAATIDIANLRTACAVIGEELSRPRGGSEP